jgi:hypothetical protein
MARVSPTRFALTAGCLALTGLALVLAAAPPAGKPADAYQPAALLPPLPPLAAPPSAGPAGDQDPTQLYVRQALRQDAAPPHLEPAPFLRQGIPDPAELANQVRLNPIPVDDDPPENQIGRAHV